MFCNTHTFSVAFTNYIQIFYIVYIIFFVKVMISITSELIKFSFLKKLYMALKMALSYFIFTFSREMFLGYLLLPYNSGFLDN